MEIGVWSLVENCTKCTECKSNRPCTSPIRTDVKKGLSLFVNTLEEESSRKGIFTIRLIEDYLVNVALAEDRSRKLPATVLQLGRESCILVVYVLRKYMFNPDPPPGSFARGALQFLLNATAEYTPAWIERTYWITRDLVPPSASSSPQQQQAPVKLYLRSFLVALSVFLDDLSTVMRVRGRSRSHILQGLLDCLAQRKCPSVAVGESASSIRAAKIARVKHLYGARVQLTLGAELGWQGGLWVQSIVRSLSPLLVTLLEQYANPYALSVLLDRMLDLMLRNAKQEADAEVKEIASIAKKTSAPVVAAAAADDAVKYKVLNDLSEERLSREYGELINSITNSLLGMVEMTGLFKVLAVVSKPLRLIFQNSIGTALSVALESSVEEDLKKVQFVTRMLFGDEVADNVRNTTLEHQTSNVTTTTTTTTTPSSSSSSIRPPQEELVEDLLNSIFLNLPLEDLPKQAPVEFSEDPAERKRFLDEFYDKNCVRKLEELILLQLGKRSKTIAKLSGDSVRQLLKSLSSSLGLVLRDPLLLDILIWDYVLPALV